MSFLAIMKLTDEDRIAKYEKFFTLEDADQHVLDHGGLFSVREPNAPFMDWLFDGVGKSVRIDAPPPKPPEPESDIVLALRDLADAAGPLAVSKLEARLGARRT